MRREGQTLDEALQPLALNLHANGENGVEEQAELDFDTD
jgi:hypothetical protein